MTPQEILAKQQELWFEFEHGKPSETRRRAIERELEGLEKQKPKNIIILSRLK